MTINSYEGLLSLIGDLGVQANLNVLSDSLRIDGVVDGLQRCFAATHHMVVDGNEGVDKTPIAYHHMIEMPLVREVAQMRDGMDLSVGVKESYNSSIMAYFGTESTKKWTHVGYGRVIHINQLPIMVEAVYDHGSKIQRGQNTYVPYVPGIIITPRQFSRGVEGIPRSLRLPSESISTFKGSYAFVDNDNHLVRVSYYQGKVTVDTFFQDGFRTTAQVKIPLGTSPLCFSNRQLGWHNDDASELLFRNYTLSDLTSSSYDPGDLILIDANSESGESFETMSSLLTTVREVAVIDAPLSKLTLLMAMTARLRTMFSA